MKRMNVLKKGLCACLAAVMLLTACGGNEESTAAPEGEAPVEETGTDTGVTMRVAAMTGPTGMGLAYLMEQFGVVETMQSEPLV